MELTKRKAVALIKYAQKYVLQIGCNGRWMASWVAGIDVEICVPGHGPRTMQQSIERFNSTIKGTMPVGYHLLSLSLKDMVINLERVIRVHMKHHGQASGCEKRVVFTPNDPTVPHRGLVSADWVRPGRDEQDVQLVLPPVWRFLEHLPSNFHGSTLAGALQIRDVLHVYAFPKKTGRHDRRCGRPRQNAPAQAFAEAGKSLNLFKEENELDMLSVPRLRTPAVCAHHFLCRWFEKDGKVQLAIYPSTWPKMSAPQLLEG